MQLTPLLTRRAFLATGLACGLSTPAAARTGGWPATGRLAFEVWRGKQRIGRHSLEFRGDDQDFTVAIDAEMVVKLGPVPVFRYRHQATESWRGGRFAELHSTTGSNGKREAIDAVRSSEGVVIRTLAGKTLSAVPGSLPLTHWNREALLQPLFNPQTGAVVRKAVSRQDAQSVALADARTIPASRYTLTGDAQIVDWYDGAGVWAGLRGRAEDGSYIEYRRLD